MDKIKEIRIREKDGSLSGILPIGADAKNVEMANGNSVEDEINNKASKNTLNSLNKEVELLENRVNILSSLEEGSTTGDAELQDIRVGADGVTYPTAGAAIRSQITNIKNDLTLYTQLNNETLINNISVYDLFHNIGYLTSDGSFISGGNNYYTSDYLEIALVSNLLVYMKNFQSSAARAIVFYDINKNVLGTTPNGDATLNHCFDIYKIAKETTYFSNIVYVRMCTNGIEDTYLEDKNGNRIIEIENKINELEDDLILYTQLDNNNVSVYDLFYNIGYITNDGSFISGGTNYYTSDYLKMIIFSNTLLYMKNFQSSVARAIAFYDINKNILGTTDVGDKTSNYRFDIYEIAKEKTYFTDIVYIRICTNDIDNTYLQNKNTNEDILSNFTSENISNINLGMTKISKIDYDYNIVLCYGQSLSCGYGGVQKSITTASNCYMLGDKPYTRDSNTAIDQMVLNHLQLDVLTEGEQNHLPPVLSVLNDLSILYGDNNKKFISIVSGAGNTTVAQLMDRKYITESTYNFHFPNLPSNDYYSKTIEYLERIKAIANDEGKTCGVVGILFIQGEADYTEENNNNYSVNGDSEEWKARVKQLQQDFNEEISRIFQQELPPAFFVAQCGGQFIKSNFGINKAQQEIIDNKEIFALSPNYMISNTKDGHLTPNGYIWWGEYIAQNMYDVIVKRENSKILKLKDVKIKNNSIYLSFYIPSRPLQIDTYTLAEMKNYGFEVWKNETVISILKVELVNDVIKIITNTNFNTDDVVKINYAVGAIAVGDLGSEAYGEGNICDSSIYNSYYNSQLDMPRTNYEVEYYPKDNNGQNIIDKNYPMKNFLLAFSKEIVV